MTLILPESVLTRATLTAKPVTAAPLYVHQREPRPEWQQALDDLYEPGEALSKLVIAWEPGDPWAPVQRWVVWHALPRPIVRADVLAELEGPDPRSEGHYCGYTEEGVSACLCPRKRQQWVGGTAVLIDRRQWELYRMDGPTKGHWCRRYWIVQGTTGGHRWKFSSLESKQAKARGLPAQTPVPGDLPYAEPDRRTYDLLGERNLMRRHAYACDFLDRTPEMFDAEERDALRAANAELWDWLDRQFDEAWQDEGAAITALAQQYRRGGGEKRRGLDADEERERFITTFDQ